MIYWKIFRTILLGVFGLSLSLFLLDVFLSMMSLPSTIAVFVGLMGATAIFVAVVLVFVSFVFKTARSFLDDKEN